MPTKKEDTTGKFLIDVGRQVSKIFNPSPEEAQQILRDLKDYLNGKEVKSRKEIGNAIVQFILQTERKSTYEQARKISLLRKLAWLLENYQFIPKSNTQQKGTEEPVGVSTPAQELQVFDLSAEETAELIRETAQSIDPNLFYSVRTINDEYEYLVETVLEPHLKRLTGELRKNPSIELDTTSCRVLILALAMREVQGYKNNKESLPLLVQLYQRALPSVRQ